MSYFENFEEEKMDIPKKKIEYYFQRDTIELNKWNIQILNAILYAGYKGLKHARCEVYNYHVICILTALLKYCLIRGYRIRGKYCYVRITYLKEAEPLFKDFIMIPKDVQKKMSHDELLKYFWKECDFVVSFTVLTTRGIVVSPVVLNETAQAKVLFGLIIEPYRLAYEDDESRTYLLELCEEIKKIQIQKKKLKEKIEAWRESKKLTKT